MAANVCVAKHRDKTGIFRPPLPAVIGNEGVGRVLALGPGVESVRLGDRVLAPPSSFTWRERMVISAGGLFALPADADPQQLAMLAINPPTAALLLSALRFASQLRANASLRASPHRNSTQRPPDQRSGAKPCRPLDRSLRFGSLLVPQAIRVSSCPSCALARPSVPPPKKSRIISISHGVRSGVGFTRNPNCGKP